MYSTILVPLDGSKRAEAIINHVAELARNFNSKLILMTVLEPRSFAGGDEVMASSMEIMPIPEEDKKMQRPTWPTCKKNWSKPIFKWKPRSLLDFQLQ